MLAAGVADGALLVAATDDDESASGLLQPQTIAHAQTAKHATMAWRHGTVGIGVLRQGRADRYSAAKLSHGLCKQCDRSAIP
ncbi:hypothetical protein CR51_28940 [Caballeronia megalochromosomata]|nr:hypothetical protein CR51_28940 [Caballeronia megalochromosomata]